MEPERLRLKESPATERFLSSDGQVVDVTGHDPMQRRLAAVQYFEERTEVPKPTKAGLMWLRIEGSSIVRKGGLEMRDHKIVSHTTRRRAAS